MTRRYRVAVLGRRNVTPVSGMFPTLGEAVSYARKLQPEYAGRVLVVKEYSGFRPGATHSLSDLEPFTN